METAEDVRNRMLAKVDEIQEGMARMEANFKEQAANYEKALEIRKEQNEELQRELAQAHMRIEELSK